MLNQQRTYRIFISAAEPSADALCAALIKSVRENAANVEFLGFGGKKMRQAGCRLLENTVGLAAMGHNAFGKVFQFHSFLRRFKKLLDTEKFDLVIVCDSPAFNFHIAKAAKKANLKTLFYVAPQLWAWGAWRIKKLQKSCDRLCCILPFEKTWFAAKGINTTFIGHPLLDELNPDSRIYLKTYNNFDPTKAKIALLPGSREAEIKSLWQPFQKIALRLKQKYPQTSFTTVAVDEEKQKSLRNNQLNGFVCQYRIGSVTDTAKNADFCIVASGSAALQVAAAGCPMVIMYQSSRLLWHLVGKRIIKTKYLSLVNILAGKELVPEFMPYFTSIEPAVQKIEELLGNKAGLAQISRQLVDLAKPVAAQNAAGKVANIVIEMLSI